MADKLEDLSIDKLFEHIFARHKNLSKAIMDRINLLNEYAQKHPGKAELMGVKVEKYRLMIDALAVSRNVVSHWQERWEEGKFERRPGGLRRELLKVANQLGEKRWGLHKPETFKR